MSWPIAFFAMAACIIGSFGPIRAQEDQTGIVKLPQDIEFKGPFDPLQLLNRGK